MTLELRKPCGWQTTRQQQIVEVSAGLFELAIVGIACRLDGLRRVLSLRSHRSNTTLLGATHHYVLPLDYSLFLSSRRVSVRPTILLGVENGAKKQHSVFE